MTQSIVILGDKTNHGGTVISATSEFIINGIKAAKVGDLVNCPKKGHGVNKIIDGDPSITCNGIPLAVTGSHTECGCTLIASTSDFITG
ncbi:MULTISPECIES: PAAR domain-containing protein [Providencia]|uniref:PAAR domain-containing protein n=1 Tax=Providencia TaxID=586 RepID=UPI001C5B13FD|nr:MULTISPECIES: PAAR domain-containing protein [Providencia]QXX83255.1 PAAR domain-containing protein [Providencia sp. R33]